MSLVYDPEYGLLSERKLLGFAFGQPYTYTLLYPPALSSAPFKESTYDKNLFRCMAT
jgi:hypothetical protein